MVEPIYCSRCNQSFVLQPDSDGRSSCPKCGDMLAAPTACDVFISYASADLSIAQEVAGALRAAGVSPWVAPDRIRVGESFVEAIPQALAEAKAVVLIFSTQAVESRWVKKEVIYAAGKGCPVIPFRTESFEVPFDWHFVFQDIQFEDSYTTSYDRLVDSVQSRLLAANAGPRPKPVPAGRPLEVEKPEGVDPSYSPYVGPQPFPPDEERPLFGRQREAEALLKLITSSRVVLVYAPSGAGKSSLLNTLIARTLKKRGYDIKLGRVGGALPADALDSEIRNIFSLSAILSLSNRESVDTRWKLLHYLRSIGSEPGSAGRVLIFDQFEELFTGHKERHSDRAGFLEEVEELLRHDASLRVVFAIRQEYLADVKELSAILPEDLPMREFYLGRVSQQGALEAIVQPARPYARFAPGVAESIVEQLSMMRVVRFDGEPITVRGEYIEMAHLQIVCNRLWVRLPAGITCIEKEHLEQAIGEGEQFDEFVLNALDNFYDDTIEKVANSVATNSRGQGKFGKDLIKLGCLRFVTTSSTRRMVQETHGRIGRLPDWIVQQLEDDHLLRVEQRGGNKWYELSHDILAAPVGRKMDRELGALLFASDLLEKVLEKALQENGGALNGYFVEHRDVLLECRPFHSQPGLFEDEAEFLFRTSLRTGQDATEWAERLAQDFPATKLAVLQDATGSKEAAVRENAAELLGRISQQELDDALVRLATADENPAVRRAASLSLARLDRPELYAEVLQRAEDAASAQNAIESLGYIRMAADSLFSAPAFDGFFSGLSRRLRGMSRRRSWGLRLSEKMHVFPFLFIPTVTLASIGAASFKWFPGMHRWAVCQASASAAMGIFHGITAGVIWAGLITFAIMFYHVVFGRTYGPRSFIHSVAPVAVGAASGFVTSLIVVMVVASVYTESSLTTMGWIDGNDADSLLVDLFVSLRYGWVYPILGTGLGIGFSQVITAVRRSERWQSFLEGQHGGMSGLGDAVETTRRIMKLVFPHSWPLAVWVAVFGALAYFVPATGGPQSLVPGTDEPRFVALWHGIVADGLTQIIGAYFGVCGLGLGLVMMRRGLNIEPQEDET